LQNQWIAPDINGFSAKKMAEITHFHKVEIAQDRGF
jgi:hypothetical protein